MHWAIYHRNNKSWKTGIKHPPSEVYSSQNITFLALFLIVVAETNLMLERNSRDILTLMTLICRVTAKCETTKMKMVYHGFMALLQLPGNCIHAGIFHK